jgi:serine phosphatase RsbU (regulator of sigma subunit)/putative methionine-R-sulfoxide reductase with GAF domain
MVVEKAQKQGALVALEAFASAGGAIAAGTDLDGALRHVVDATANVTRAIVLVRVLDSRRAALVTRAVAASSALAAELEGTEVGVVDVPPTPLDDIELLPLAIRNAATSAAARSVLVVPVSVGGRLVGTVELLSPESIDADAQRAAKIAAGHVALTFRAFGPDGASTAKVSAETALEFAADALAVGWHGGQAAEDVVRLAALATGASAVLLWQIGSEGDLALEASYGLPEPQSALEAARSLAARALAGSGRGETPALEAFGDEGALAAALPLGEPPLGALQLLFAPGGAPGGEDLAALGTFAVQAANTLRRAARSQELAAELERTRALLGVVAQASAQLSLAHALETTVEQVALLLGVDKLAVYLREQNRLVPAAARGLAGPHVRVAERLLELALGPLRTRSVIAADDVAEDLLLAGVAGAAAEAAIVGLLAVPLIAQGETIGLLVAYPRRLQQLAETDVALLVPLANQLAVTVQNALLHERANELSEERQVALAAEQQSARQLRALYEISRSFAQSLSLEATLEAVSRTVVDILDVDAAVIAMPDERQEQLIARATCVADPTLADAAAVVLARPQPFGARPIQRLFREGKTFKYGAGEPGQLAAALAPFLARGWTAAAIPVATPAEVIAALTLVSFRVEAPIGDATIEAARAIGGQAALAIDNARLYQQQKQFADTMQRSLLPASGPEVVGLDVGAAYESAARVEVGGDVYDFLELPDGRLAVVLGDVTGHGVEATADMAMAKFVFRSLAREHPDPADFLSAANDVVVGEIAPAKFITMTYVTVAGRTGNVAAASAGHPPARLLYPDGCVAELDAKGLVLGVGRGQVYEETHLRLPVGGAVVLYTDGVLEARRDGEIYGVERLDALLSERHDLPAAELAAAVVEDSRAFAGSELSDDCAVVVIKRVLAG